MQDIKNNTAIDLRIDNAQIADVFSGTFFHGSVCVHKGIIVGFSEDMYAKKVLDAENAYLLPAFFDAHVHIESSMLVRKNLRNWSFLSEPEPLSPTLMK